MVGGSVCSNDVENLAGRLSHVAQVVSEGYAYLQPLIYSLERARVSICKRVTKDHSSSEGARGRCSSSKPQRLAVGAATEEAKRFRADAPLV